MPRKLEGYRDYRDGRIIYDEDVYQYIKKHSRFIDRLNPRKMIEMYELASAILNENVEEPINDDWMFVEKGKRAPKWK